MGDGKIFILDLPGRIRIRTGEKGNDADREVSLTIGSDVFLSPSVAICYGLDGGIDEVLYIEASVGYKKKIVDGLTGSLGAAAAYLGQPDGDDGMSLFPPQSPAFRP